MPGRFEITALVTLSMFAAIQVPVIMINQNRHDKNRVRGELDFDVNPCADAEIQSLSDKLNPLYENWR